MSNDLPPLKYMGTQSQETVNMAAALAATMAKDRAQSAEAASSKISDAANWALGKATDALHSAAEQARARATRAVASYTREDPIRAILIAAGVGAVLMGVLAMMARSGARSVQRRVQR